MPTSITLTIANRNYSSWSLRPWLLMRALDMPFKERQVRFSPTFHDEISRVSPAGRVPVLVTGELVIWDSLAIVEYLAERFPQHGVWPTQPADRARARSVCAEMHSGFSALRQAMPMNIEARLPGLGWSVRVQDDIDRIVAIWTGLRAAHSARGPFLFGAFGAVDAFFAPVVSRMETHQVATPPVCDEYRRAVLALPAMQEWTAAALAEHSFVSEDEPYRRSRD
jgi:glutathione S-transferase